MHNNLPRFRPPDEYPDDRDFSGYCPDCGTPISDFTYDQIGKCLDCYYTTDDEAEHESDDDYSDYDCSSYDDDCDLPF